MENILTGKYYVIQGNGSLVDVGRIMGEISHGIFLIQRIEWSDAYGAYTNCTDAQYAVSAQEIVGGEFGETWCFFDAPSLARPVEVQARERVERLLQRRQFPDQSHKEE